MSTVVVFDLDSTLADTRHRQWMIPLIKATNNKGPTWDGYSVACEGDTPIASTVFLARWFNEVNDIVIVTGRSEAARQLTVNWLLYHSIPFTRLIMRPAGDRTPNPIFKVEAIDQLSDEGHEVRLVVDDYQAVADAMRHYYPDIPVLIVNPGYHGVEGA